MNERPFYEYRLKFSKNGPIRFVGHLDVMRYMQKANRRACLPVRYSEGFSPHQIMSFALPLSVGATSDGEYLDISLTEAMSPSEIMVRLNSVMHEGIAIRACVTLPEHAPKAMTVVAAASYRLRLAEDVILDAFGGEAGLTAPEERRAAAGAAYIDALRSYLSGDALLARKRTKKGERQVDLKPLVHSWRVGEDGTLEALLHAGSRDHVKPALLFESFLESRGRAFSPQTLLIHRVDLYREEEGAGGAFVPLIP